MQMPEAFDDIVLRISNVSKSFGAIQALQGVDFELRRGEIHAIAGENGAGKSTLMNIIDGILQPDSGEISSEWQVRANNVAGAGSGTGDRICPPGDRALSRYLRGRKHLHGGNQRQPKMVHGLFWSPCARPGSVGAA